MKISSPKVLRSFLETYDLKPRKGHSQNFLIDGNIVSKIIGEAAVKEEDLIIEIGPGPGALTEMLLETGCKVLAVEKDEKLASLLNRLNDRGQLEVHSHDFLDFPIEDALKKKLLPGQKGKVVANLPYHITTPILVKLSPLSDLISDCIVMVQKEVAERFIAKPGSKDYSSFTIFLSVFTETTYCFTIEPSCFYPKPSVQSAVVHLRLKKAPEVNLDLFFTIVHTAFQQRRKKLTTSLKNFKIEPYLTTMELPLDIRPEKLSVEHFLSLTRLIEASASSV